MKSSIKLFLAEKNNKRKFIFLLVLIVFLAAFFAITMTCSYDFLRKNAKNEIKEKAQLNSQIVNEKFNGIFSVLYSTSSMISLEKDIKSPEVLQKLRQISLKNGFDRMAVTTPDGMSYTDDDNIHNSKNRSYFIESMNGKEFVTEIEKSNLNGKPFIAFSCPIVKDQTIVGVLRITISKVFFKKLVNIEDMTGTNDVFLIDPSGSVVLISEDNIFNKMLKENKKNISSVNNLEQAALNSKETCINYLDGNKKMYAYTVPFHYNDWSIITTLSEARANKSYHMIYLYSVFFPAIFVVIIIVNLLYCRGSYKQFVLQNKISSKEISIISSAPTLYAFWYDIKKRTLTFSEGFQELIGCRPSCENIPDSLIDNDYIFSEHTELLSDFFERLNSGMSNNIAYIKIRKADGNYSLFKISSTTIYYKGLPLKAVGYLENTGIKGKQDSNIAVYDSLTGLYNKLSIKNYVNNFINNNSSSIGALLIVDIYNFNLINEKLGYSYGDKVIKDIADQLKSLFRSSDIIARSSDDEFLLFMKDVNSVDLLTSKINKIIDSTNKIIPEDESMSVSVNIGVAMFPQDGDEFNELFKNSTTALIKAKRKGGGYFEFYSEINL